MRLKTRLQLSFLLFGLLSVGLTGWQTFEYARNSLEALTFDRLTSIRETKKRQIETYFHQTRIQIVSLAESRVTVDAMKDFGASFRALGRTTAKGEKDGAGDFRRADARYHTVLQHIAERFGYQDLFLVDAVTGNIVYSVARRRDFGTSLISGPYDSANIAAAFRAIQSTADPEYVRFVDFAPYEPASMKPAAFVATSIYDGSARVGVLIAQMSIDEINNVMTSGSHWLQEGLGRTGETYIVGDDFSMRNDSRFFIQDPAAYIARLERAGADSLLVARIQSRSTSILIQEVRTDASREALGGATDTRIIDDYRGVSVLSSFTPLAIPDVHWVILSEIDASEAFHPVFELRERLIFLSLGLLLGAVAVGFVISRTISGPILALAKDAETLGKGDFSHRAGVRGKDEIGMLARTFNAMASSIMEKTAQMRGEIVERKRAEDRLKSSRERLRNLSTHLQSVREDERRGVAREIHDELGQALTTLKLDLSLLRDEAGADAREAQKRISSMIDICDTTIRSVKRIITELRPRLLDDLGLTAAMEWMSEEFQRRTGIATRIAITPAEIVLDPERSTAIFRIFQETLTNIGRHSGATVIDAVLRRKGETITLEVRDNGRGISEEQAQDPRSFGLIGMRERAKYFGGSLTIKGTPHTGTVVTVTLDAQSEGVHS
jgi:signal transduction histidine kinase